ncbi:hypothetical protein NT6N_36340 [Oceaniferula spumae]|uniref:ABC transporter domain-containing protein n=1 Tax=Oceaniferula spumae TaxID=2979115 RepID=A0AAT9FRR8_9BACT
MSLAINQLHVSAGEFTLAGISLAIPDGECAVLMGRSGVGKTTLMEAICGLRSVDAGSIVIDEVEISALRPSTRDIGLVPQDTVLFPHLTVREHLAFGPSLQGWRKSKTAKRVTTLADSLQLTELLDRKPKGLSGGEAQRVAIGRAIAGKPKLLCLDEALTGLDNKTHDAIMHLLKKVTEEENLTTLHITHREEEADFLGDLIYSLEDGAITLKVTSQI